MAKFKQVNNVTVVGKLKNVDADKLLIKRDGKRSVTLLIPVVDSNGNEQTFELFSWGEPERTIFTMDTNFKSMQVDPKERFNPDVVKNVSFSRLHTLNVGDREVYIDSYDYVMAVHKAMKEGKFNGKTIMVKGTVELSVYNNKVSTKLRPRTITEVKTEEERFEWVVTTVVKPNAIVENTKEKIVFKAHVSEYLKLEGEDKRNRRFLEQDFTYYKKGGKVDTFIEMLVTVKDGVRALYLDTRLFKGAAEVTVSELTDDQKFYIELGLLTEEQARKDNTMKDNKETVEVRVVGVKLDEKNGYGRTGLVPEDSDEFLFGIEPKVDENKLDGLDALFSNASIDEADMPFDMESFFK